jgi:hypothetical protein
LYEDLPRKFDVDLDLKPEDDVDNLSLHTIITTTTNAIKMIFEKEFKAHSHTFEEKEREPCIFVSSHDKGNPKKSAHLIFPSILFRNLRENQMFVAIIKYHMLHSSSKLIDIQHKALINKCFDFNVYTKNRVFRLPYQSKKGKNNILIPSNFTSDYPYLVGIYKLCTYTFSKRISMKKD